MANMTCVSYIEMKVADYQNYINKCMNEGKRTPDFVKKKFFELSKQKAVKY